MCSPVSSRISHDGRLRANLAEKAGASEPSRPCGRMGSWTGRRRGRAAPRRDRCAGSRRRAAPCTSRARSRPRRRARHVSRQPRPIIERRAERRRNSTTRASSCDTFTAKIGSEAYTDAARDERADDWSGGRQASDTSTRKSAKASWSRTNATPKVSRRRKTRPVRD